MRIFSEYVGMGDVALNLWPFSKGPGFEYLSTVVLETSCGETGKLESDWNWFRERSGLSGGKSGVSGDVGFGRSTFELHGASLIR